MTDLMRVKTLYILVGDMEYKKDKRTKNLTLRDIHIGDWVQEWSPLTERYDPPTKVMSISDDGDVLLIYDDKHRLTPNEARIENIDALPIDADLLRGFGFEKLCDNFYYSKDGSSVMAQDKQLGVLDFFCIDKYGESASLGDIAYMHELQQALHEERNFIETFKLEWKGIEQ